MGGTPVVAEWPITNTLTTNLQAYWKLDESSSNIVDVVNSYPMVPYNSPTYGVTGKLGNAVAFDRTTNQRFYAHAALDGLLNSIGYNGLTISLWVKITGDTTVTRGICAIRGTHYFYFYATTANKIAFLTNITGTSEDISSNDALTLNEWYHVVMRCDRSANMEMYVNGTLQTDYLDISGASSTNVQTHVDIFNFIGNYGTSSSYAFTGVVDDIAVYNRTLSASEISQLYNSGNGLAYPFS
jgi:hypothetical protein